MRGPVELEVDVLLGDVVGEGQVQLDLVPARLVVAVRVDDGDAELRMGLVHLQAVLVLGQLDVLVREIQHEVDDVPSCPGPPVVRAGQRLRQVGLPERIEDLDALSAQFVIHEGTGEGQFVEGVLESGRNDRVDHLAGGIRHLGDLQQVAVRSLPGHRSGIQNVADLEGGFRHGF